MPPQLSRRRVVAFAWLGMVVAASFGGSHAQAPPPSAFFYQTVSPSAAVVRAGATWDGTNVRTYDADLVTANLGPNARAYGDPVFSRLADGRWTMTARVMPSATHASGGLAYFEGTCPMVNERDVRFLAAATAAGCNAQRAPLMAKSSQVVSLDGSTYVLTMSGGEIYLTRLSSPAQSATALTSICMRRDTIDSIHDLSPGDSGQIIAAAQANGMLLSDTAITRRTDGTWVMFVKGIGANNGCSPGSLCELCGRSIYRATSDDLVHWTVLEKVAPQASVPEAARDSSGTVWLYYQSFSPACAASDPRLAGRAPITGVFELDGGTMSQAVDARFSNEDFETDTTRHYATNANPITLPDMAAYEALNSCFGRSPR